MINFRSSGHDGGSGQGDDGQIRGRKSSQQQRDQHVCVMEKEMEP